MYWGEIITGLIGLVALIVLLVIVIKRFGRVLGRGVNSARW